MGNVFLYPPVALSVAGCRPIIMMMVVQVGGWVDDESGREWGTRQNNEEGQKEWQEVTLSCHFLRFSRRLL